MNSFKGVKDALNYEIQRQSALLDLNEALTQETRLWDPKASKTITMRTKEGAKDYRYFPEPDLPPFIIKHDKINEIRISIPELPKEKMRRFINDYGISEYDSKVLVASKRDAIFAEECIKQYPNKDKKAIVNWFIGPLLSEANNRAKALADLGISIENLLSLVAFVEREEISHLSAKAVLTEVLDSAKSPEEIIKEKNLIQVSDSGAIKNVVEEVLEENTKSVSDYKAGKSNALMFLVGQVMRKSGGKTNPKVVQELLKARLGDA